MNWTDVWASSHHQLAEKDVYDAFKKFKLDVDKPMIFAEHGPKSGVFMAVCMHYKMKNTKIAGVTFADWKAIDEKRKAEKEAGKKETPVSNSAPSQPAGQSQQPASQSAPQQQPASQPAPQQQPSSQPATQQQQPPSTAATS